MSLSRNWKKKGEKKKKKWNVQIASLSFTKNCLSSSTLQGCETKNYKQNLILLINHLWKVKDLFSDKRIVKRYKVLTFSQEFVVSQCSLSFPFTKNEFPFSSLVGWSAVLTKELFNKNSKKRQIQPLNPYIFLYIVWRLYLCCKLKISGHYKIMNCVFLLLIASFCSICFERVPCASCLTQEPHKYTIYLVNHTFTVK